jgi:hypothetical protein
MVDCRVLRTSLFAVDVVHPLYVVSLDMPYRCVWTWSTVLWSSPRLLLQLILNTGTISKTCGIVNTAFMYRDEGSGV